MSQFEVGKTYKDRLGNSVRIIGTRKHPTHPLVGVCRFEANETEGVRTYTENGQLLCEPREHDLIPPPPPPAPCPWCGSEMWIVDTQDHALCSNDNCQATGPLNDPTGEKWNRVADRFFVQDNAVWPDGTRVRQTR